jgi:myosin heavy subunit
MAAFAQIFQGRHSIADKYFAFLATAQENRMKEYDAALRIKRAWRAFRNRRQLEHQNQMAIRIQKRWRKYRARVLVQCLLVEKARADRIEFFNGMATRIQRCWRGYYFRRHVFDYKRQQQYLNEIAAANTQMRRQLDDHYAVTKTNEQRTRMEHERRRQEENALRSHHLVSTAAIPSIFQPPSFTKESAAMPAVENFIRSINRARIVVPSLSSPK